jgi:hypothetical protein
MVSGKLKNRAKKLAGNSKGNIKAKRLLSSGSGITGSLLPNNYLFDEPIISYFKRNEQPHYFFYNESKGVRIGEIREKSGWSGTYRNSMWVTDRGIHFTVGSSSGDFHHFLSFSSIKSVEARSGVTKGKFVFETDEGQARFPTDPTFDLDPAADFVKQKISASSSAHKRNGPVQSTENTGDVSLSTLQQMNEYDFEYIVAQVWQKQGWETEVTSGSTDRGVDIIAVKSDPFEQRQYIQAKRYAGGNKVGSSEIQKYSGLYARNESVDSVVVVTTSGFTSEAQNVAANRNVKLINGTKLIGLINRYEISI